MWRWAVEDLKAKAMSATAEGTLEHPGVGVAQKRGLNRGLQGVGIRAMLDAIERSCRKNGTGFLGVAPHYTSQTCSLCGELGQLATTPDLGFNRGFQNRVTL